jgi:pimeloyl-ACP methyl ester carboxylesterase
VSKLWPLFSTFVLLCGFAAVRAEPPAKPSNPDKPIWRSLPATATPTRRDRMFLPKFRNAKMIPLRIRDRFAYLIEPSKIETQKRWVWIFPFEHALQDSSGHVQHGHYIEQLLAAGFHVAGISVGVSCGSPTAGEVCHEFYKQLVEERGLARRPRLLAQSNGGLIAYAWAFRHPTCVERIGGIYPVTDLRTWPGRPKLVAYPSPALGYNLSMDQLSVRLAEFNPIENLAPLARSGVRILHLHGDQDHIVPLEANSAEHVRRYTRLGGSARLIVMKGLAHGGKAFFESPEMANFLAGD